MIANLSNTAQDSSDAIKHQMLEQLLSYIDNEGAEWLDLPLFRAFLQVFWAQINPEDWQSRETGDIAGCCYSLWLALRNSSQSTFVRVFNPSLEEDRWLCNGTAILVRQTDMPFLVDSLRLEVNRRGLPIHVIKSTLLAVARMSMRSFASSQGSGRSNGCAPASTSSARSTRPAATRAAR